MEWVKCDDRLPELRDDSVLVYFSDNKSIGMVHIEDYFEDITAGRDEQGELKYTKWYLSQGVTHWMELPETPNQI